MSGLSHTFNGNQGPSYSYAYDNIRNITSKTEEGNTYLFTYDKLNRIKSGNILNQYSYDIWGNPEQTNETVPNNLRYAGEYWDEITGLQYLRARWYDPSVGRFIHRRYI
ncbi:RHS repeat-associated core domain-containing protein [Paenibacillus hubeiensis]|uniref:RHS repeat-associated core domain-containing protein n=1 Tax=Paenibacillus hubeiensis TaxID=3077330 RepID=UPI003F65047D